MEPQSGTGRHYVGMRRSDLVILVFSILISASIWLVHYLSREFTTYIPIRVEAVTNIEGYSKSAISNETILLGGQTTGFRIIERRSKGAYTTLRINVDASRFTDEGGGHFTLNPTSLREQFGEALDYDFDISYIQDSQLSFDFVPQSYRKVPVVPNIDVECLPQYMVVSDFTLKPDSVTVYGNAAELSRLSSISTEALTVKDVSNTINGIIELRGNGFRVEPQQVEFSAEVARYFECSFTAKLSAVNVPEGKRLILLPSKIKASCRVPFGVRASDLAEPGTFVVDYNDFLDSRGTQVVPRLNSEVKVLGYTLEPGFVECALSDDI